MSAFADLIEIQTAWAFLLLSDDALDKINIVTRDYIIANESRLPDETLMREVLAYTEERAGKSGCGVIVEKAAIRVPQNVSPGPHKLLAVEFLILEDRLANEAPQSGTLLPADWVGQRIIELGHQQYIEGVGDFYVDPAGLVEARDLAPLNAWRVTLLANLETELPARLTQPDITANGSDEVVLTNDAATPDAEIFYTTDGSFPARTGNSAAQRYAAPFAVASGTVVRWAAYQNGYLPSRIGRSTITINP